MIETRTTADGSTHRAIYAGGAWRLLATRPSHPAALMAAPTWKGAGKPDLPRSEWREIDTRGYAVPILDQLAHGSCTDQAVTSAHMRARERDGRAPVLLSSTWCYAQCNGGRDQGASIADVVAAARRGSPPAEDFGQDQIYPYQAKPGTAARAVYRIGDAYRAERFSDIASGLTLGYFAAFGLVVGDAWEPSGAERVCPVYRGTANHALCGAGLRKSARFGFVIPVPNSWSIRWGDKGWCNVHEGHFDATWYSDIWLIRHADMAPADTPPPRLAP